MPNDRRLGTTFEGKSDMQRVIVGAVIGCVFALIVLMVLGAVGFLSAKNPVGPWARYFFTVFAIVGAVAGGTKAILARLDQMRIP
jgi:hypothetical protein